MTSDKMGSSCVRAIMEPIIRVIVRLLHLGGCRGNGQQIMKVISEDLANKAERNVILNVPVSREREVGIF